MIIIGYLCVPQGDSLHESLTQYMNHVVKSDNRRVIAAMIRSGHSVPDTVGEMGLRYVPEKHRLDEETGEPIIEVYGMGAMVARGTFSCADATAYESAVHEEKYGIPTWCMSVAQGDEDAHAVFVTRDRLVDPTLNFIKGRRDVLRVKPLVRTPNSCSIQNGRVVCEEDLACSIDQYGIWSCPDVPGLDGRREKIESIHDTEIGGSWAKISNGAVAPLRRRGP